jgi:general secretion pathway protein G
MRFPRNQGFTMIEILGVVTIIGILAAIVFSNFSSAKVDTKNKAFKVELEGVQVALELYRVEFDRYPGAINDVVPDFIIDLPGDAGSANESCSLVYQTDYEGSYYKYTAEKCHGGASDASEGIQPETVLARCPSSCTNCDGSPLNTTYVDSVDFYETYAIYSDGGQCL